MSGRPTDAASVRDGVGGRGVCKYTRIWVFFYSARVRRHGDRAQQRHGELLDREAQQRRDERDGGLMGQRRGRTSPRRLDVRLLQDLHSATTAALLLSFRLCLRRKNLVPSPIQRTLKEVYATTNNR